MYKLLSFVVAVLLSFVPLCDSTVVPREHRSSVKNAARQAPISDGHWVDTWTAMPQLTEPANLPPPPFVSVNSPDHS